MCDVAGIFCQNDYAKADKQQSKKINEDNNEIIDTLIMWHYYLLQRRL